MSRTLARSAFLATFAAYAGAAAAQSSSVTLFGTIDINARQVSNDGSPRKNLMGTDGLNSSRLGFRGTEDMGGGLTAGFWLEAPMTPNDGNSIGLNFRRRSTVSIIGQTWGELRLGRDYTPVFWTRALYDPFGFNGIGLSGNVDPNGLLQPTYVRSSNAVSYLLPARLGGVYGQFTVAPSEGAPNTKYYGGRLGYAKGPFDVSVAASRQSLNGGANRFDTWVVGGSYNAGFATLEGTYSRDRNDTGAGTTFRHWMLGTVVPIDVAEIHASYNDMDAGAGNGARMAAIGLVYNASKRSALYATYSHLSNEGAFKQSVDFSFPAAVSGATPVTPGGTSRAFEVGIRHLF
ncbi:MAG: porin [Proteobacteria bacterium]|nr:porin [Pseudomonadota bacterium]